MHFANLLEILVTYLWLWIPEPSFPDWLVVTMPGLPWMQCPAVIGGRLHELVSGCKLFMERTFCVCGICVGTWDAVMQSHLLSFIQPINSDEHVQTSPLHTCTHSHTCSCICAHELPANACMYSYTWSAHRGSYKHVTQKTSRESGDQRCRVQTGFGVSQETRVKTPNRALIISRFSLSVCLSISLFLLLLLPLRCWCEKSHFPTVLPEVLLADTQRKDASSFYKALVHSILLLSPLFFYSVSLWWRVAIEDRFICRLIWLGIAS